ncbi:MAG TPA: ABC transporter permease [Spirochaetales bacterium]|nr:ABC transporter permease [Spirochaetales bacterium]
MVKSKYIIRHEFRLTAANKTFVVLTILGPFLIFAVTALPTLLAASPGAGIKSNPIAVYGAPKAVQEALQTAFSGMNIQIEPVDSVERAKEGTLSGELGALLVLEAGWPDGGKALWFSKTGADVALYGAAKAALESSARSERIRASGVQPEVADRLLAPTDFDVVKLEPHGEEKAISDQAFLETLMTVLVFIMLLYMTILLYGQMIGRSVVTEKTSKTVEIMLSSVTSRELMMGKIAGLGLAGILQYAVWTLMAFLLNRYIGPLFGLALPAAISMQNMGWLLVFFLLGFFLYASAYAGLGAASEDEQNLGQLAWPLIIFLIVPLVMLNTLVTSPDSTLVVVLSIFPLTSPIVMLARILVSSPPFWQLALCLSLLVVAVVGMMILAAKIFRVGILMTGKRPKLQEVLRWIRVE